MCKKFIIENLGLILLYVNAIHSENPMMSIYIIYI